MGTYALIKIKDGLLNGLKTYYYEWSGKKPPEELINLEPVREDVSPWINYIWWSSPAPGVPNEFYAITWLGFIKIDEPGTYRFYVTTDDGSRLWIDDTLVIDAWKDQPPTTYISNPVKLSSGYHRLKYYFYNRYGLAEAVLGWIPPRGEAGVVPKNILYHSIGDIIFFTGIPDDHFVEVLVDGARKTCKAIGGICEIRVAFEEQPLEALVKILDKHGNTVYRTPDKITIWGGDELKLVAIGENNKNKYR